MQYKSPQNTDNNITICNLMRNVYMKATGIVRRIGVKTGFGRFLYIAKGAVKKQTKKEEATNLQKSRNVASFVV